MKNLTLFTIIVVTLNCILSVFAENDYYYIAILRNKKDKTYDEASTKVKNAIDDLVNDRMNDIYDIISENKDTYVLENGKMDEKLEELESSDLKKRNESNKKFRFINNIRPESNVNFFKRSLNATEEYIEKESEIVSHLCPVKNYYIVRAYLSDETVDMVKDLDNVTEVIKNTKTVEHADRYFDAADMVKGLVNATEVVKNTKTVEHANRYYDIDQIFNDVDWNQFSVQRNALTSENFNSHITLISQGRYYSDLTYQYDNNFYYPTTGGHGIDIYLIDRGFGVDHTDFDSYRGTSYERTVSCDAFVTTKEIEEININSKNRGRCSITNNYPKHGIMVASLSGGQITGVAKKANLHMVATELDYFAELLAFDYVKRVGKPYKTVISISRGGSTPNPSIIQDKIDELSDAGFIIVTSAGNDGINVCEPTYKNGRAFKNLYASFDNVITVGATDRTYNQDMNDAYRVADYSNYGPCVDIFAPGEVRIADLDTGEYEGDEGTSCSAPIVAGVVASIMAEHPNIKYTVNSMIN